jgi:hypothetical protein
MSGHPELDELEDLARGAGTAGAAAHLDACQECAREVAWAKAERALFARRAQPDVSALWTGVAERLGQPQERLPQAQAQERTLASRRRPHWHRPVAALAGAAAAAAVLLFALRPHPVQVAPSQPVAQAPSQPGQQPGTQVSTQGHRSRLDPKTMAALDTAETDYRHAATVLEAEYGTLRLKLDPALARRWDETLTRARTQLGESRAVAADDVRARMRVLDSYAEYLRSLRDVIQDSEEATP